MIAVRLFAGVHLHPVHAPFVSVGFLDRGVEDAHGSAPDVGARPIALDEWNDGIVGHAQRARVVSDAITAGRDLRELVDGHAVGRAVLEDGPSKLGSADWGGNWTATVTVLRSSVLHSQRPPGGHVRSRFAAVITTLVIAAPSAQSQANWPTKQ